MSMYRCPRCNVELLPDARFCPRCGFNQTNARMQKVVPPQAGAPPSVPATPLINPDTSTAVPPTPSTSAQPRSFQPDVKRVIPPRAIPPRAGSSPTPAHPHEQPPASPQMQVADQQSQHPVQAESMPGQESKNPAPPSTILPVRTNTPPKVERSVSATPPPPSLVQATPPKTPSGEPARQAGFAIKEQVNQSPSHTGERVGGAKLGDELGQATEDAAKGKGLSLTKRYISEQETRHQPALPSQSAQTDPPARPPVSGQGVQSRSESVQPSSLQQEVTPAIAQSPVPAVDPDALAGEGSESLIATSKAAERWRQSWRDRQRAEAGPAIGITRGQAQVPEPLMAMQHSIARMRAVIIPKNTENAQGKNFTFWFTLVLLICIIGGLSSYAISTYIPSWRIATQSSSAAGVSPVLTMQGAQKNTLVAGQTLRVHGTYFGPNHVITFSLATTSLIPTSPVQTDSKGTFTASLPIPATWLAGSYALQAQDNQSGLHAFLNIQILPGKLVLSNNTPLALTTDGQPVATKGLTFKVMMGKSTSPAQRITFTNGGNTPVQWSVTAVAGNSLNWLLINSGKTGGTLDANGTDSVDISVSTIGLKSSTKPYAGSVIFTVNTAQAIVPVSLVVQDAALEVIVDPDPVIAYLQGGGTCQPVALTLINLSNQVVTWNANPYDVDKPHIHLDGQASAQGTLDPVGLPHNTRVIQITCIGAQTGEKLYHISVYYNGIAVNVPVSVRNP